MSKTLHTGENCRFITEADVIPHARRLPLTRGRQTVTFENAPRITGRYSVVGEKEGKGPLGKYFHKIVDDDKMHEKTFEKAEIDMLTAAIDGAAEDCGLPIENIDLLIAGDLLNQITSSSYVAREMNIPYMGVYSACSTMSESLAVGAAMINAGYFENVMCATASHFATAERQFRYPLEYGCQRPPYAQWTVTAAGASVISAIGNGPKVVSATFGRVVDFGTNDLNNMGAAMAPAAADTLKRHLFDTGRTVEDYDLIITGDLGSFGSELFLMLLNDAGIDAGTRHLDCGNIIFSAEQNAVCGGSGCGCSAVTMNGYILPRMDAGEYNRILFMATGALMSPTAGLQGESIPGIAHGVVIERR